MKTCTKCHISKSLSEYYNRNARCKECIREYNQRPEVKLKRLEAARRSWHKVKDDVINKYGGHCVCCWETNRKFLTLDHKNGNGRKHRKQLGGNNLAVYRAVRDAGYPDDYQVLCFNCNCGRSHNGGICPHLEN